MASTKIWNENSIHSQKSMIIDYISKPKPKDYFSKHSFDIHSIVKILKCLIFCAWFLQICFNKKTTHSAKNKTKLFSRKVENLNFWTLIYLSKLDFCRTIRGEDHFFNRSRPWYLDCVELHCTTTHKSSVLLIVSEAQK